MEVGTEKTSRNYWYGTIDIGETLSRRSVLDALDKKVVLVAGFGAESPRREKVLLGKNSSDLVAAVISSVDGRVDEVVYFKDVDGVYRDFGTPQATLVREISFAEARFMGLGKVLDSRSLDYARCNIRIQSHEAPIGSGTLITKY